MLIMSLLAMSHCKLDWYMQHFINAVCTFMSVYYVIYKSVY